MVWNWIKHNSLKLIAATEDPLPCLFMSNVRNLRCASAWQIMEISVHLGLDSWPWQNRHQLYKDQDFFCGCGDVATQIAKIGFNILLPMCLWLLTLKVSRICIIIIIIINYLLFDMDST